MNEKIIWRGKIGGVIEYTPENQPNKRFERFARPPGTRTIIISPKNKILLTKEFRQERGIYDYRLPGGKVFDTFDSWREALEKEVDMFGTATRGAKKEVKEEAAIEALDLKIYKLVGTGGPTVEWDLYYLTVEQFKILSGQLLEEGEDITFEWYPIGDVIEKCFTGEIDEARTAAVILQFLYSKKKFRWELTS